MCVRSHLILLKTHILQTEEHGFGISVAFDKQIRLWDWHDRAYVKKNYSKQIMCHYKYAKDVFAVL